ncbi:MAG: NAD-dependent epimerase/dehydratase family protein [Clostridia bacterium]
MKTALVTGCAGFIGSHLTRKLLESGYHVVGIDSFVTNYEVEIKQRTIRSFLTHPHFTFFAMSLQQMDWQAVLPGVDEIYHQAALPGVRNSWGSTFATYVDHNITATQMLLEGCLSSGTHAKIVIASSSSVYGTMQEGLTNETAAIRPVSPYGVTKAAMEQICNVYVQAHGLPVVMLRYFTVYGPGQRPDMAFHRFISHMLRGKPILLYGDGKQSRDFTYVSDIVEANLLAAQHGSPGDIFNIGGDREVELLEVVRLIGELMNTSPQLTHLPPQPGDSRRTCADIRLARHKLGYQPAVSLRAGLAEQIRSLQVQ